jgi:hypothetical protein
MILDSVELASMEAINPPETIFADQFQKLFYLITCRTLICGLYEINGFKLHEES